MRGHGRSCCAIPPLYFITHRPIHVNVPPISPIVKYLRCLLTQFYRKNCLKLRWNCIAVLIVNIDFSVKNSASVTEVIGALFCPANDNQVLILFFDRLFVSVILFSSPSSLDTCCIPGIHNIRRCVPSMYRHFGTWNNHSCGNT